MFFSSKTNIAKIPYLKFLYFLIWCVIFPLNCFIFLIRCCRCTIHNLFVCCADICDTIITIFTQRKPAFIYQIRLVILALKSPFLLYLLIILRKRNVRPLLDQVLLAISCVQKTRSTRRFTSIS